MRTPAEIREAFAPTDRLCAERSFFLVGIGGAGMSAVARMLRARGFMVRGSDSTPSALLEALYGAGIDVRIGHSAEDIRPGDQVVFSDAIDLGQNPEASAAREQGCNLFRRSQILGWLLRSKKVIAVTGTHGKTTTTGMIGAALRASGMHPTIVVGASVPQFGGSVVEGDGDFAVVEACEAYDGLRDIDPQVVVLTNLEPDHMDYHGSWDSLKASLARFVRRLPADGSLIFCATDPGASEIAREFTGRQAGTDPDWFADKAGAQREMALPGRHNLSNASLALRACDVVGANISASVEAIEGFQGAERRLQVAREGPVAVIDDYAHHPTEVRATIQALRERYPDRRLILVFQPHLYSRTALHIEEFASSLSGADRVVITDIYPAREDPIPGISSARIVELCAVPVDYVPCRHLLARKVAAIVEPGDLVVGMGAGNISEFVPAFLKEFDRQGPIRVAVVYAGDSAEREVSILSGRGVAEALRTKGYVVDLVDVSDLLLRGQPLDAFAGSERPDVGFLCVHGTNAEDGAIQGLFELLGIPYTGSGIQASAIAMDKELTKLVLMRNGIRVPQGQLVWTTEEHLAMRPPVVVKPNAQGSTVGLSFVRTDDELPAALARALAFGSGALVEEWIAGMEISVPVLGDRALPPVEIVPKSGVYDFAAKYEPGATDEICPARLPREKLLEAQEIAVRAHACLGCSGATRTDMMVRDGEIFELEINTIPGFTGTSILPNSARAAGISFEELCDWMVQDALARRSPKA